MTTYKLIVMILVCTLPFGCSSFNKTAPPRSSGSDPLASSLADLDYVKLFAEKINACTTPCTENAIVFVHGIFGSKETWINEKSGAYWPALVAEDPDYSLFDIFRIDYETHILATADSLNMDTLREKFWEIMNSPLMAKYKRIFFIAHSLGGNVVRDFLTQTHARYAHNGLNKYRLVVQLATPAKGSYLATIASLIPHITPLQRVLLPAKRQDYLGLLNKTLNRYVQKRAENSCLSLRIYAAGEKLSLVPLLPVVVDQESAGVDAFHLEMFDRTHSTIAKPSDRKNDIIYKWVSNLQTQCLKGSKEGPCPPPDTPSNPGCNAVFE